MENHYASRIIIDARMAADDSRYAEYAVESAKREGAYKVFSEIYKANHPVVVETHLEKFESGWQTEYTLHYRLTAVQSRKVIIPVFEFETRDHVKMWKCFYCGMVNVNNATYCGEMHKSAVGCGHSREDITA
jgi:hypothetical protein